MTPETSKRLVRALANIDALRRTRGQLDEEHSTCLERAIAEFANVTGRTAAEAFIAWGNAGAPFRDPRPRKIEYFGGEPSRSSGRLK